MHIFSFSFTVATRHTFSTKSTALQKISPAQSLREYVLFKKDNKMKHNLFLCWGNYNDIYIIVFICVGHELKFLTCLIHFNKFINKD